MMLDKILDEIYAINKDAKVVAVSKYVSSIEILNLFEQGQIEFGENRVQDLVQKKLELSNYPIKWHMIGRLQSNKINHLIAAKPVMWQSCDSFERAKAVDDRLDYMLDVLLQVNAANESSKQGVEVQKTLEIYEQILAECKNINLLGVMSIGANSHDLQVIENSFKDTYSVFEGAKKFGAKICSMGMSGDYKIALECGSNMLRLGSILFKNKF